MPNTYRDYSGQIIKGLKLNKRIEDYLPPGGGKGLARYNCTCLLCGNNIDSPIQNIKNRIRDGCGCIYKNTVIPKYGKRHDITNQRFGWCVAKERLDDGRWKCLCDCGELFITSIGHLTSGHTKSCGCYRRQNSKEMKFIDLTGQIFHELTVEKYLFTRKSPNKTSHPMWLCLCSCGSYTIVSSGDLKSGAVKSCGCIGSSYREKCIRKWLNDNHVKYVTEYKFENLRNKRALRFDFAIFSNNILQCLIEHQGKQHFEEYSKKTKWGKLQREVTDKMKEDYCSEHCIPLYKINFNEDINIALTNIFAELHVDTVPSLQETA